ncbi:thiamine phosphate synthase [bacterium]|nr:thiamine phosphate synthase [candidate division CSSED10-310 bacterium]
MSKPTVDYSLYVVTDRGLARGRSVGEVVRRTLEGGAGVIQYREKESCFRRMLAEAAPLAAMVHRKGAVFLINDRVDLALAVGADGVHLGRDDMPVEVARRLLGPGALIGASVQNAMEAREAVTAGADYLGVSGVFATATKTDVGAVLGVGMVREIAAAVAPIPVVAIGGINTGNAAAVIRAGAAGLAVVSAVVASDDIEGACRDLLAEVAAGKKE